MWRYFPGTGTGGSPVKIGNNSHDNNASDYRYLAIRHHDHGTVPDMQCNNNINSFLLSLKQC